MKINEILSKTQKISDIGVKEDRRVGESRQTGFQSQLKRVDERNYEERLRNLAQEIIKQGETLSKRVDVRELKVYKKMISEFLHESISNSSKFSKESFLDRRGRHKVYAIIKKINHGLDDLTKDVLSSEKDNIKILQRIEDIRGLILDIVL